MRTYKKNVPCIMADDLTDDQIKAFRLVDNRTNEIAAGDFDKLEAVRAARRTLGKATR